MTYNVFGETLNLAQSQSELFCAVLCARYSILHCSVHVLIGVNTYV